MAIKSGDLLQVHKAIQRQEDGCDPRLSSELNALFRLSEIDKSSFLVRVEFSKTYYTYGRTATIHIVTLVSGRPYEVTETVTIYPSTAG